MSPKTRLFVPLAVAAFALDQLSKAWIIANFHYGEVEAVIPGVFDLTHVRNPGGAFSFFADGSFEQRMLFFVGEVVVLLGFGVLVLGTPLRGSLAALTALCLAGALAFSGLGLLVSARSRTLEAVSGWMNLVMMPMWLVSGIFFSYHRFPEVLHGPIRALPLTGLNDGLRAVMLEGAGLAAVAPQVVLQLAWAGATFALALRIFRWA